MREGMEIDHRGPTDRLSEIDKRILRLVAQGRSSKEIGQELGRSPLTIDSRLKDVCTRLGADNRVQAATMLIVSEGEGAPPNLGGPQSWRVATSDQSPPAVGEDSVDFARPVSTPASTDRVGESGPAEGEQSADQNSDRSLLRVIGMFLLVLVGIACAAFFLASAIEAGQGVFQSIRGVG